MTGNQLESKLAAIGVHKNSYSLGSIRHSDCVCVVNETDGWKVYYVERDKPDELAMFSNVEEAYDFVYQTFSSWLGKQAR